MNFVLQPWQLLVVILTGWLNRQQQAVIDFLLAEAQVLKETHGKRRIRLSDDQRRHLAIKGNADDYFLIDSAFIGQSGPLGASRPEPAIAADMAVQPKAKKAEPDSILSQLFSTGPVL